MRPASNDSSTTKHSQMTSQSSNHHGVMEVVRVIESAHDSEVVAIAYNAVSSILTCMGILDV